MSSTQTTNDPINDPITTNQVMDSNLIDNLEPQNHQSINQPQSTTILPLESSSAQTPIETPAESTPPVDTKPTEPLKVEDEKKDKKQSRKPFVELLNKILKPHPHGSSDKAPVTEKKPQVDAGPANPAQEEVEPSTPVVAPEVTTEAPTTDSAPVEPTPEVTPVDDSNKDVTTPKKERGNILEKITAFVLKPKSPKAKKSEVNKDDAPESKPDAVTTDVPVIETSADASTPIALETSPTQVPETTPAIVTETPASAEVTEEPKTEKKEKTPKDLAKLARRFSGRIFGGEKKKDASKKPEPTAEETEETAPTTENTTTANPSAAPQIPDEVNPAPESSQTTNESTPIIAAAA
ncbi:hypothetical protein O181_072364 [Austropuccinia psidii MF-1]|uniref:Uncharacterized protein n=1 Tax=Austropuccinia psidii MF-1 TaxID=1389203 RepID=A0A9Q3F4M3_9BASI|nr:hypothetical protein [Austropuccinia psidii MF-1]